MEKEDWKGGTLRGSFRGFAENAYVARCSVHGSSRHKATRPIRAMHACTSKVG